VALGLGYGSRRRVDAARARWLITAAARNHDAAARKCGRGGLDWVEEAIGAAERKTAEDPEDAVRNWGYIIGTLENFAAERPTAADAEVDGESAGDEPAGADANDRKSAEEPAAGQPRRESKPFTMQNYNPPTSIEPLSPEAQALAERTLPLLRQLIGAREAEEQAQILAELDAIGRIGLEQYVGNAGEPDPEPSAPTTPRAERRRDAYVPEGGYLEERYRHSSTRSAWTERSTPTGIGEVLAKLMPGMPTAGPEGDTG
jgi:hypothetical protein